VIDAALGELERVADGATASSQPAENRCRRERVGARRGALILSIVAVGAALLSRMVALPWAEHIHAWITPVDVWTPVPAARSVANGDVFHLYEPLAGRTGYPYTPLLPILLAPFMAIGDHFTLLGSPLHTQQYPGMFLLIGPAEAFLGTFPIVWVAGRAARTSVWRLQVLVFIVSIWAAVVWFHPEDTIACACLLAACLMSERDTRVAGAFVAVAILTKQWAIWPAIPIVLAAPRGKRMLSAFYAFAIPALVMTPFFLASDKTYKSLTGTLATLGLGQPQLWTNLAYGSRAFGNPDLLRLAWGVVSVAVALRVRRAPTVDAMIAGVGIVMLARLLFEPVLFGYYLVPAAICAIVWCERNARPYALRAVTAAGLCAFCLPHTYPQPVFFAMLAFGMGYVCGPMFAALIVRNPADLSDGATACEALGNGGQDPSPDDPVLRPRRFDRAARASG
jgi:hypothetical protein